MRTHTKTRTAVVAAIGTVALFISGCSATASDAAPASSSTSSDSTVTQTGGGRGGPGQGGPAQNSQPQNGAGPNGQGGPAKGGPAKGDQGGQAAMPTISGELSQDEIDLATFMREEERMAHELYTQFDELYDLRVFSNIATSETKHFEATGSVLDYAGVADPSEGAAVGSYAEPELQQSYDAWLAQGQQSLKGALEAAVDLEEKDITDLKNAIEVSQNDSLDAILQHLLDASENHLAAFSKQLANQ